MQIKAYCLLTLFIACFYSVKGQSNFQDSIGLFDIPSSLNKKRLLLASGTSVLAYSGTMYALDKAWYEDFPKSKFHTFNDWGEWENMDKAGHVFSAYLQTAIAYRASRWTGIKHKNSALVSFGISTLIQGSIEWLDGHSNRWGWSWHDIGANTLGSAIYASQQYFWEEQKIRLKFSYSSIDHSKIPIKAINNESTSSIHNRAIEQFGESFPEQLLKDYGGQTYWLSVNPHSFLNNDNRFPAWLNLAIGYGANNVIGAYGNSWSRGNNFYRPLEFEREKQVYLSLDIDLRKIKTKNKFLRTALNTINVLKIPAPTVEFNSNGKTYWHFIHF